MLQVQERWTESCSAQPCLLNLLQKCPHRHHVHNLCFLEVAKKFESSYLNSLKVKNQLSNYTVENQVINQLLILSLSYFKLSG